MTIPYCPSLFPVGNIPLIVILSPLKVQVRVTDENTLEHVGEALFTLRSVGVAGRTISK